MFEKGEKEVKYWNAVKQVITGLCLLFVFVLAAGLVQPSNAFAQEGWGPGQDTWKFELGGYFPSTNTELQVSGIDSGNDLDLEDKLGFSDSDAIFRLDGYWRFYKSTGWASATTTSPRLLAWESDMIISALMSQPRTAN